jgi:hypothetical protein
MKELLNVVIIIISLILITIFVEFYNLNVARKNLRPGKRYYYRTSIPYTPKATIIEKENYTVRYIIDENLEKVYTEKISEFLNHWIPENNKK